MLELSTEEQNELMRSTNLLLKHGINSGWMCPKCKRMYHDSIKNCIYCKDVKREDGIKHSIKL